MKKQLALGGNVTSLILSYGTALRAACAKVLTSKKMTNPYSVEEIVDMKSPRMQRAMQLVAVINSCGNEWDIAIVRQFIIEFNNKYPEHNPLMSFLENKAWDLMACKRINDIKNQRDDTNKLFGAGTFKKHFNDRLSLLVNPNIGIAIKNNSI